MKKFMTLCLAALMALASATAIAADDVMLISAEAEGAKKEIVDLLVIDDVNTPKTAPLYVTAFGNGYDFGGGFDKEEWVPVDPRIRSNNDNFDYGYEFTVATVPFAFPRQVTIKVNAGENGTVDVPAKFFAACTSSRTFNIKANDGYEVADILVNGVSYGPANSVKLKNIQTSMDIEVLFAPKLVYTPVYTENFDGESTVWVAGGTAEEAVLADGKLSVTSIGGDPNVNYPEAFGLNCDDIDVIRVKYTNNTADTKFQIFFTNEANPGYSEAGSFVTTCAAGENEIVIETAGNELWTGILSNMRIDLSNGEGSFVVDSISFETVSLSK